MMEPKVNHLNRIRCCVGWCLKLIGNAVTHKTPGEKYRLWRRIKVGANNTLFHCLRPFHNLAEIVAPIHIGTDWKVLRWSEIVDAYGPGIVGAPFGIEEVGSFVGVKSDLMLSAEAKIELGKPPTILTPEERIETEERINTSCEPKVVRAEFTADCLRIPPKVKAKEEKHKPHAPYSDFRENAG